MKRSTFILTLLSWQSMLISAQDCNNECLNGNAFQGCPAGTFLIEGKCVTPTGDSCGCKNSIYATDPECADYNALTPLCRYVYEQVGRIGKRGKPNEITSFSFVPRNGAGVAGWNPLLRITDAVAENPGIFVELTNLKTVSVSQGYQDTKPPIFVSSSLTRLIQAGGNIEPAEVGLVPGVTSLEPFCPAQTATNLRRLTTEEFFTDETFSHLPNLEYLHLYWYYHARINELGENGPVDYFIRNTPNLTSLHLNWDRSTPECRCSNDPNESGNLSRFSFRTKGYCEHCLSVDVCRQLCGAHPTLESCRPNSEHWWTLTCDRSDNRAPDVVAHNGSWIGWKDGVWISKFNDVETEIASCEASRNANPLSTLPRSRKRRNTEASCPPVVCESCNKGYFLNNGTCSQCILADITSQSGSINNVTCNAESLTIGFSDDFHQHACVASQNFTVGIAGISSCPQSTVSVNQGRLEFDIDNCLVQKNSTLEELIFKLEFEIVDDSREELHGIIINEGQANTKWSVSCTFDRIKQVEVENSVQINQQEQEFETNVDQEFEIQMETFQDQTYTSPLNSPIVKTYGDDLFFQVSFDDTALPGQSSKFHLITESCWATPDINQISQTNVTLIENGCKSTIFSSILDIVDPRNSSNVDRWNSRVFRFPDETQIVIRCTVRICYEAQDCARDCTGSRNANKRRNGKKTLEKQISTGLIILANDDESSTIRSGYAGFLAVMLGFCLM